MTVEEEVTLLKGQLGVVLSQVERLETECTTAKDKYEELCRRIRSTINKYDIENQAGLFDSDSRIG